MQIEQIQQLVREGFEEWKALGHVSVKQWGNLLQFNYTREAYATWNDFECLCRGLIIEAVTGKIVARPFDKFFNYGEDGRYPSTNEITQITEKIDGSMGIIYYYNDEWQVATRGSFISDQAIWAQFHLDQEIATEYLHTEVTYIAEIIYKANQIVVNYGNLEGLVLIGARVNETGEYLAQEYLQDVADKAGFLLPIVYMPVSPEGVTKFVNSVKNFEGCVAIFADGTMWKFKSEEYMRMHKLVSDYTFERVVIAHRDGLLNSMLNSCPEYLHKQIQQDIGRINDDMNALRLRVYRVYNECPRGNRKKFALYVQKHHPDIQHLLFARLDNKLDYKYYYKHLYNI